MEEPDIVKLVRLAKARFPSSAPLVGLPLDTVDRRFRAIMEELGLPYGHLVGYTPASLRAGKATHLFEQTLSHDRVRAQLRHKHPSSTDRYILEASAAIAEANVSPQAAEKVRVLSRRAGAELRTLYRKLENGAALPLTGSLISQAPGPGEDVDSHSDD
jgi:hypothetical protein